MRNMFVFLALVCFFLVPTKSEAFWAETFIYEELTGYWITVEEKIDPWTDEVEILQFALFSEETLENFSPQMDLEQTKWLGMFLIGNVAELVILWNDNLGENRNILYRLDQGDTEEQKWNSSRCKTALLFPGDDQELKTFVKRLIEAERLVMGVTPEGKDMETQVFDVRGLGNAILPYLEYFGWEDLEEIITAVSVDEE